MPRLLVLAVALLLTVPVTPAAAPCADLFPAAFAEQLRREFPSQR